MAPFGGLCTAAFLQNPLLQIRLMSGDILIALL